MKGFIELRALGGHKAFFPIERIAFGNSNIGTLVFFNSSTYGVEETAEEIAAKIEAATEQKTETCEWCDENFRYTQGGMEKRRHAYDTEDIDIGCWRYCPVCGRKVEARG